MKKGVVAGADSTLEWLLPWWWRNYSRYNSLPVAFADFGLSEKTKKWCEQRGLVFDVPHVDLHPKTNVLEWERIYGRTFQQSRPHWFKKPSALLSCPFKVGLWLDIDCEVCAPLLPLFDMLHDAPLGLVREKLSLEYNSGVLLFRNPSSLLHDWDQLCRRQNDQFLGDQNALGHLLKAKDYGIRDLPAHYNWMMSQGVNPAVVIAHWAGAWGKEHLRKHGGLHELFTNSKVLE